MKTGIELEVIISKTSTGDQDYLQITSKDMISVNVVLVADKIKIKDSREVKE